MMTFWPNLPRTFPSLPHYVNQRRWYVCPSSVHVTYSTCIIGCFSVVVLGGLKRSEQKLRTRYVCCLKMLISFPLCHSPQLRKQSSPACPSTTRRSHESRPYHPAAPRDTLHAQARQWQLGTRAHASLQLVRALRTAFAERSATRDCPEGPIPG